MTKVSLLAAAALFSTQLIAAETDSVYSWGEWSQGVKPAAGNIASVTPPPAQKPQVNFRPNENRAFGRNERVQATVTVAVAQPVIAVPEVVVETAPPISSSFPATEPPPPAR